MKKQQKKKKNSTDGNEHFAENQSWRQKAKMRVKRTEFKSSTHFPGYAKATKNHFIAILFMPHSVLEAVMRR